MREERARQIFSAFMGDALRLAVSARECVTELSGGISPERVKALYHAVHTLKGTSQMVPGAKAVVESLHELESVLDTNSVTALQKSPEWLNLARRATFQAFKELTELERRYRDRSPMEAVQAVEPRGLLVEVHLPRGKSLLWLPLEDLLKVAGEVRGRFCELDGNWVPVLTLCGRNGGKFGVGIRLKRGAAVTRAMLLVEELREVVPWSEARRKGASALAWDNLIAAAEVAA